MLLLTYIAASRPPPGPEAAYLGVTATVYHLIGLYGGVVLVLGSAFGRQTQPTGWVDGK